MGRPSPRADARSGDTTAATPFTPASAAGLLGLFVLALLVRLLPWRSVFWPDGVHFFGGDAWYHLRRIQYSLAHFPAVLDFDPFLDFPHGGQPIWPPTLDWLIALALRPVLGPAQPELVERSVAFLPPLVGAVTVVALTLFARRFYAPGVAWLAGAILAVLPAHVYYSQLGFVDHHVVVGLLSLLLLAAGMGLLRAGDATRGEAPGLALRRSALLGAAMAACLLLWPGSLIHVAIVQGAMLIRLLSARERTRAIAWAQRFALANAVACACVLPLCAGNEWRRWGSFSAVVLSDFQPFYLGSAALCFALPALAWRRGWRAHGRPARAIGALGLGAALLGLLLLALPPLRAVFADAWDWFAKREEFQAAVNESVPLFGDFGSGYRARATVMFTGLVYAVPLAIAGLGWEARHRAEHLLFLGWALVLFAATLVQWRFADSYAVAHALLLALVLSGIQRLAWPRLAAWPRLRWAVAAPTAALVILLFSPVLGAYRAHATDLWRGLSGEPPIRSPLARQRAALLFAARWLRANSPSGEEASYSVLAPWGDGHILEYVAQRPVVQDNFGDDVGAEGFELAEDYFAARSEEEALDVLARTRSRYVLVRASGSGHARGPYAPDSLFARLFDGRGSSMRAAATAAGAAEEIPALGRHRLVYQSPLVLGSGAGARPYCALYEIVPGARLLGEADPGARVQARLPLRTLHGARLDYVARTRADARGRYALRLPYSNEAFSSDVRAAPRYELRSEGAAGHAVVPEQAVRSGAEVAGPSLRSGGETPPAASG